VDSVSIFLLGLSGLFIAGIVSEILFKKTKIPDALWLVILGILIGPVFDVVSVDLLKEVLPFFASFALIVILFEGGRQLRLSSLRSTMGRATLLGVATFFVCGLAATLFSWVGAWVGIFDSWSWLKALMVGAILGGSSSIIIIPTMNVGKVKEEVANLVTIESAVTDAMSVVFATIFIKALLITTGPGALPSQSGAVLLLENIGFGLMAGLVGGFLWIVILPWIPTAYSYLITLSTLLGFYVLVQNMGGSSALAILVFAVLVGNAGIIGRLSKLQGRRLMGENVNVVHFQLSFVVKVFFFVIVGMLLRPPIAPMVFGMVLAILILGVRPIAVHLGLYKTNFSKSDRMLVDACGPRGLAAGVLATLPISYGIVGVEDLATVVFAVIVTSIIVFAGLFAKLQTRSLSVDRVD